MIQTAEPWTTDALCAQVGGDEWFPDKGQSTRDAKAVCQRCPVTAPCLAYAIRVGERFGVWGGTTERDRRAMQRKATP